MAQDDIEAFAAFALLGMLAHPTRYQPRVSDAGMHWHDAIAREAFEVGEAMDRERDRRRPAVERKGGK